MKRKIFVWCPLCSGPNQCVLHMQGATEEGKTTNYMWKSGSIKELDEFNLISLSEFTEWN